MTDEALVYERLGKEFAGHGTVNHSADEYVRTGGFHHTNTVESFFTLFKRAVYGQFHFVSEARLHRYLAEADSNTITARRSGMTTPTEPPHCCAAQRASGFYIDSLTKPRTPR
jgi:hypothetical protein